MMYIVASKIFQDIKIRTKGILDIFDMYVKYFQENLKRFFSAFSCNKGIQLLFFFGF